VTVPTQQQLQAEHDQYLHYTREAGSVPVQGRGEDRALTPQDARDWGAQVLATYARDRGQSASVEQINEVAAAFKVQDGRNWSQLNIDQKRLSAVLANSATASLSETQFDAEPALAQVAIETLRDGRITEQEVHSMCSTAGSVAGAVVGQAFGVPAPIGAFIGGLIGGVVGGIAASIAGLDSGPGWIDYQLAQARREAEQWRDWQRGVRFGCSSNKEQYGERLDYVVAELSQKMRDIERRSGGLQLRLVWSGDITLEDTPFFDQLAGVVGAQEGSYGHQVCSDTSGTRQCTTYRYPMYSCDVPGGCLLPGIGGQSLEDRSEREVVNALMFYGATWKAQNDRYQWFCSGWPEINATTLGFQNATAGGQQQCNVLGTRFPPIGIVSPVACDYYKATMRVATKPVDAMAVLEPARLLTVQAIVKTAAAERARMDIRARKSQLARAGARVKRSAWKEGQQKSWWANNGVLALGVGVLGYALWKARQEGRL